jgi:hypothetical protein
MAGREEVGYEASDADLFVDRPWVVVPGALAGESDIERVTELAVAVPATSCEWTRRSTIAAVAAISHLPLIDSAALVEALRSGRRRQVARGGTRRVAGRRRSGCRRLARHVPSRPRRSSDGRRHRRDECDRTGGSVARPSRRLDAWQAELDVPMAPRREGRDGAVGRPRYVLKSRRK